MLFYHLKKKKSSRVFRYREREFYSWFSGQNGAPADAPEDGANMASDAATATGTTRGIYGKRDTSDRVEELATTLHLLIQKFNPLRGTIWV